MTDSSARRPRVSLAGMPSGPRQLTPLRTAISFTAALLLQLAASALAQTGPQPAQPGAQVLAWESAGALYVEAASLAVALGDVVTATGDALTWRGADGVATYFLGSSHALLQAPGSGGPDEWALSAPVLKLEPDELSRLAAPPPPAPAAGWLLPLDAVQLLGVATVVAQSMPAATPSLRLPNGGVVALALPQPSAAEAVGATAVAATWEVVEIGGVPALRFYVEERLSLLLLDLDLAPLAFPEATAVIDETAARVGSDHALLLIVSASEPTAWDADLVFQQDGRVLEVRHPYRLRVYHGSAASVGPDEPAAGVVLLPNTFSLYRPLSVSWSAIEATVTFRH